MARKEFIKRKKQAIKYIRNYFAHHGKAPTVRDVMRDQGYKSPNSAMLIIESLIQDGLLTKGSDRRLRLSSEGVGTSADIHTAGVPLVGYVACGAPILAAENVEAVIPVSRRFLRGSQQHFLLRAVGDSMNQAGINNGDVVLVRKQPTAEEGERVVALINDSATIKEFRRVDGAVILKPRSDNPEHQPIVVTDDIQVQGVVVATLGDIRKES